MGNDQSFCVSILFPNIKTTKGQWSKCLSISSQMPKQPGANDQSVSATRVGSSYSSAPPFHHLTHFLPIALLSPHKSTLQK